jgi:hypothetical protein
MRRDAMGKFKHGCSYNPTPEYRAWSAMLKRCYSPSTQYFEHYGGRGITACDEWRSDFSRFLADMGERPPGTTLDRKDNDKGYCKENCRWATRQEQGRNRRTNALLVYRGETRCITEWAEVCGISVEMLRTRLKRGWSIEDAIAKPVQQRHVLFTCYGESKTLADWADFCGLAQTTIQARLMRGWSIQKAIEQPAQKRRTTH